MCERKRSTGREGKRGGEGGGGRQIEGEDPTGKISKNVNHQRYVSRKVIRSELCLGPELRSELRDKNSEIMGVRTAPETEGQR